jgi:carboxyl-terminal processing protease
MFMQTRNKVSLPWVIFIVLIIAILAISVLTKPSTEPGLGQIEEAWQVIFNDYVDRDKLDPQALSSAAIRGMLEASGDVHAAYYDAEEYKALQARLDGTYGGIGAVVTIDDGQLTVIAPIVGTPAERGGIKPRDKILEIDGESTVGLTLEEAAIKIQGEIGTQVTLLVLHEGEENPVPLVFTREEVNVPSVYEEVLPGNIAYVRITSFSTRTDSELVSALENVLGEDVKGIILDLRNNPGGTLDAAVSVASQFLEDGQVLYSLDSKGDRETWEVRDGGLATDLPLAVLVNGSSASASEVVSGAIQDQERGVLIGTQTFGKGSINHYRELSDGSAVYISIARWYTPNGRQIEGNGLTPDIVVEMTEQDIEEGKDPQFDKAIEYIEGQVWAQVASASLSL